MRGNLHHLSTDTGLIVTTYKELKKLSRKRTNKPISKWANKFPLQKKFKWLIYIKTRSTSLVIKEMQIRTTLRFHLTPVRLTLIKQTSNNKCWRGYGKKKPSYTAGGNAS
jgi:hypothetical protein